MPENRPTVICAWCGVTIEAGADAVSHGLCSSCEPEVARALVSEAANSANLAAPGPITRRFAPATLSAHESDRDYPPRRP